LYSISNNDINEVIIKEMKEVLGSGRFSAIFKLKNFMYPIKVVYIKEENEILTITCYPLKRSFKDESRI